MSTTIPSSDPGSAGPPTQDEAGRVRLAAGSGTDPATLQVLARDPNVTVRAAVALNAGTPAQADDVLAGDPDERVRALLGRRLAALLPSLGAAERDEMVRRADSALSRLVRDEAMRVRAAIADVVKEMPEAPRELVLQLAHDTAVQVSDPVIRLSPVLTDADLLGLLRDGTSAVAISVARRVGLGEKLTDAIAAGTDNAAIAALLANPTAAIRENTLDRLIARAAGRVEWHEPLVRRPQLSARAARALAEIVADHLLQLLARRADLPAGMLGELRQCLAARRNQNAVATDEPDPEEAMAEAKEMQSAQRLTEQALLAAAQRGDRNLCAAMLAVAAGVPPALVERAASLRSARGMVSLVWKAGFSMDAAGPVQTLLARLPPGATLDRGRAGGFPLGPQEMRWQLDFLGRPPAC